MFLIYYLSWMLFSLSLFLFLGSCFFLWERCFLSMNHFPKKLRLLNRCPSGAHIAFIKISSLSPLFLCTYPLIIDLGIIYLGDTMRVRLLVSINPGKYVVCGRFFVVIWIEKPNNSGVSIGRQTQSTLFEPPEYLGYINVVSIYLRFFHIHIKCASIVESS